MGSCPIAKSVGTQSPGYSGIVSLPAMLEKILGYGEGLSIDHRLWTTQPLGSTLAFGTQRKLHKKFKKGIPSGPTKRTNFKKCAQQNGQPNIIFNGSSDCKLPKWWNQIFISLTELFVKWCPTTKHSSRMHSACLLTISNRIPCLRR